MPSPSAAATTASPEDVERSRIETMLKTGHADPAWFSDSFLAQVPAARVDAGIAQLTAPLGTFESLEIVPGSMPQKFTAHFTKGTIDVLIHLDASEKIDGLFLRPPVLKSASLDDALLGLRSFPGTLSYVVIAGGRERAALDASEALAVGSSFKLAVLNGLQDEVRSHRRRWSDVVPLDSRWKSLPSGKLQDWPDATPLTIASYAANMISISDNTAADALAHIVGWKAIAPYAGSNDPLLTTRELFILKSNEGGALRNAYLAARTAPSRAAVLKRADTLPLPSAEGLLTKPVLAIEYRFSVRQLCTLVARVAALPLMSINPGAAEPESFRSVAYKGGSDVGVLNMTTMVTTKRGTHVCVSATLNNASHAIDNDAFGTAYAIVMNEVSKL